MLTWLMHPRLAHCKQMNHSRAFWAVRNKYAEQMRALWARGFTGEGLWGRGTLLSTGEFEKNTVEPGEQLPEHLCGGTYRSRSRKRKAKKGLTYKEQKERRILRKFGPNGTVLGEDAEMKRKLEKGRTVAAKPRVAASARGRELRAAAALARLEQQNKEKEQVKEEEDGDSSTESGSDYEDDDTRSEPDAIDIDGKSILDSKGGRMVKVCGDENPDDQDAQQELRELRSFSLRKPVVVNLVDLTSDEGPSSASAVPATPAVKQENPPDRQVARQKPPTSRDLPSSEESSSVPKCCPVCSFANDYLSATCAMCANVLDTNKITDSWTCKSTACRDTQYRNAGDCGVCGVCWERRPPTGST